MADKKISALTGATTPLAGTEVLPIVQGGSTVKVSVANLTAGRAVNASTVTASGQVSGNYVTSSGNVESTGPNLGHAANRVIMSHEGGGNGYLQPYGSSAGAQGALSIRCMSSDGSLSTLAAQFDATKVTINTGNVVIGTAGKGIDFSANTHAAGMTSELLNDYEEGTWTPVVAGSSTAGTATYTTQEGTYTKVGRLVTFRVYVVWTGGTGVGFMDVTGLPYASSAIGAASVAYFDQIALTATNYLTGALTLTGGTNVRLYQSPLSGGFATPVAYSAQGGLVISGQYFV
jgi:hypothetical protein